MLLSQQPSSIGGTINLCVTHSAHLGDRKSGGPRISGLNERRKDHHFKLPKVCKCVVKS